MRTTIGVPVHNGVHLIGESLECLANQTTQDFRVVISDNASTDGTSDICAQYARRHGNFEHHRHGETSDAITNFNWLLHQTQDDLFMWRAHDDLSDADYVEKLQTCFADPLCKLAIGTVETLRQKSNSRVRRRLVVPSQKQMIRPGVGRVYALMMKAHPSWIYGLWHRQTLIRTLDAVRASYGELWGFDHLTLLPTLLNKGVRIAPNTLFTQRLGITRGPSNDPASVMRARRRKAQSVLESQIVNAELHTIERWTAQILSQWWLDKRIHSRTRLTKMHLQGK